METPRREFNSLGGTGVLSNTGVPGGDGNTGVPGGSGNTGENKIKITISQNYKKNHLFFIFLP